MKMIKRTPQEWADFTGCYMVQDGRTGDWDLFEDRPFIPEGDKMWMSFNGSVKFIEGEMVDALTNHDWRILYAPTPYSEKQADSDNKPDPYYAKQPDSDNKAPHQSEVYTHQEYKTIACFSLPTLTVSVNEAMAEGWKPQGGLLHFSGSGVPDDGLFYQAMVRGI